MKRPKSELAPGPPVGWKIEGIFRINYDFGKILIFLDLMEIFCYIYKSVENFGTYLDKN